jgi:hypothetical protein
MTHLEALDLVLAAVGEPVEVAAEVHAARGLAAVLDADPSLEWAWREYRFALKTLREVSGGDVDAASELFVRLGGTHLRDVKNAG